MLPYFRTTLSVSVAVVIALAATALTAAASQADVPASSAAATPWDGSFNYKGTYRYGKPGEDNSVTSYDLTIRLVGSSGTVAMFPMANNVVPSGSISEGGLVTGTYTTRSTHPDQYNGQPCTRTTVDTYSDFVVADDRQVVVTIGYGPSSIQIGGAPLITANVNESVSGCGTSSTNPLPRSNPSINPCDNLNGVAAIADLAKPVGSCGLNQSADDGSYAATSTVSWNLTLSSTADSDADGFSDVVELAAKTSPVDSSQHPSPSTPAPVTDTDKDRVPDTTDNCPSVANTNQADRDQDGVGDVCDSPTPAAASACSKTLTVVFQVTSAMTDGTSDPRPKSNGCWQWMRPGPTSGGGFKVGSNTDPREHWWSCHPPGQDGLLHNAAPDVALKPGYWIYDDIESDQSKSAAQYATACAAAATGVAKPTKAQIAATRGIIVSFWQDARGGASNPTVMTSSQVSALKSATGADQVFFEAYWSRSNNIVDAAYYNVWKAKARSYMGGEINIGSPNATDAQVGAAVAQLCADTPTRGRLALYGGSGGTAITGTRYAAVMNALNSCTKK